MSQFSSSASSEHVGVAGSGAVACGLAAVAAMHGMPVKLWARSAGSQDRAERELERQWSRGTDSAAADRVEVVRSLVDLSDSTLVVEAVREDEFVKREVFEAVREHAGPDTLFAPTTSSLSVEALSSASDPVRFFGLHVFTPVTK